ncbi:MAG: hypothetical protein K6G50_11040 [bacterium]|nr:hypothetical protein [bacterium]
MFLYCLAMLAWSVSLDLPHFFARLLLLYCAAVLRCRVALPFCAPPCCAAVLRCRVAPPCCAAVLRCRFAHRRVAPPYYAAAILAKLFSFYSAHIIQKQLSRNWYTKGYFGQFYKYFTIGSAIYTNNGNKD